MKTRLITTASALLLGLACTQCGTTGCEDFETYPAGSTYSVGNALSGGPSGSWVFADYTWFDGRTTSNGTATIDQRNQAGENGQDIRLNNIYMLRGYEDHADRITFWIGYYGGNVNLMLNDSLYYATNNVRDWVGYAFPDITSLTVKLVRNVPGGAIYHIDAQGDIRSFGIGGQELWLDHVCTY